MLRAKREHRNCNRHADECAEQAHRWFQSNIENKTMNGEMEKCAAGHAWLDIAANRELDDIQAREHGECPLPRFELRQCVQRWEYGCDERPDEGDVVQRECDDAPFGSERKSQQCRQAPTPSLRLSGSSPS